MTTREQFHEPASPQEVDPLSQAEDLISVLVAHAIACASSYRVPSSSSPPFPPAILEQEIMVRRQAEVVADGQANAISRIASALAAEPDFNRFLDVALSTIATELNLPGCCMLLYDEEGGMTLYKCSSPFVSALGLLPPGPIRFSNNHPWVAALIQSRRSIVHPDLLNDADVACFRDYYQAINADSALSVPILRGEKLVGQINVYGTKGRIWTPADIRLAEALAKQAALAQQVTRLAKDAEETAVARERDLVVAQEGSRMAREIHDTLAQGFSAILIHIQSLKIRLQQSGGNNVDDSLGVIEQLARDNLAQARKTMDDLRRDPFRQVDLRSALNRCVEKERLRSGMRIDLDVSSEVGTTPQYVQAETCRIVQEALTNVQRHARTDNAKVWVDIKAGRLILGVVDEGLGFHPEDVSMSYGLRGMRERASRAGGELEIISAPGKGTEVRLTLARQV